MKNDNRSPFCLRAGILSSITVIVLATVLQGAEVVRLDENNWDALAPKGKEVDAIYGDWVMRNDRIVAVIGDAVDGRHANMTVRNVGGAVIDLTDVEAPNDQLSAFYPAPRDFIGGNPPANLSRARARVEGDGTAVLVFQNRRADSEPAVEVEYRLADGDSFLTVVSRIANTTRAPIHFSLRDVIRADTLFEVGGDEEKRYGWVENRWFPQAYGVAVKNDGSEVRISAGDGRRPPWHVDYIRNGETTVTLRPGNRITFERLLFCAPDSVTLRGRIARHAGSPRLPVWLTVSDAGGPVTDGRVEISVNGKPFGVGYTGESGRLTMELPAGSLQFSVESIGRPAVTETVDRRSGPMDTRIEMEQPGYVVAEISGADGGPIPCKVQFVGKGGTPTPYFFHEAGEHQVHNVYYSHNGRFRQALSPGRYDVIISYGPEHDAVFTEIEVRRGEDTPLEAELIRVVDSAGWISAELHSHSSPSGDNVASQRGRVLNLLAEHLEFAPCTEHNRVDSYQPHLEELGVEHLMATVPGIELTRAPLPLNHQNAFPMVHRPRTQFGGGPDTHGDPVQQVKRLYNWDDGADKLMQKNHPNIIQMFFDSNLDGRGDESMREVLPYLDVIEVHPPHRILEPAQVENRRNTGGNRIHSWLLMLNQGMWLPGVVNTDAHWNFHGSGRLRNYIYSPEDDPAKVEIMDLVRSLRQGRIVMSTGPFMQVALHAAGGGARGMPGDTVVTPGGYARLFVRVQCANWLDIDRVQILVNGRQREDLNFTRSSHPEWFGDEVVKFNQMIPLELEEDAHIIVVAIGENSTLGPVMGPRFGRLNPVAVSNPVFVDLDGNGFIPNRDTLDAPLPLREGD